MEYAAAARRFAWGLLIFATLASGASAQTDPYGVGSRPLVQPRPTQASAQAREHPLVPAIQMAKTGMAGIQKIRDYDCTLVKRERIGGKLGDYEYIYARVRHEPFSVYMYFLSPEGKKGQQVLYINGRNSGKLQAKPVGIIQGRIGVVSLAPDGPMAMRDNRYPITEVGIKNLTARLIEVAEHDKQFGECSVKFFQDTKVNDRTTTCIEVVHPVPRRNFRFHIARIFIDDELRVPIRYEAYGWPQQRGGKPVLLEEYTYLNLRLNNGYTDADFTIRTK